MKQKEHIVIIGNGIAGITAARHIRRNSKKRITVISSESDYFFARTALMYLYMGHLNWENLKPYEDWFWSKNNIELLKRQVETVDTASRRLYFSEGDALQYDRLIIASGSRPKSLEVPGEELVGVQGLVSLQDLELLEENSKGIKRAVIVGGGLIGVELAEMLHSRNIEVEMLIRESSFWRNVLPRKDSELVENHISRKGIRLRTSTMVSEMLGGPGGRVRAVKTSDGTEISCDLVGVTIGVRPNVGFLKKSDIDMEDGILVDSFLQTNQEGVYAIGDCAQLKKAPEGRNPLEALWYTARMMGETVAQTICGNPFTYQPGPWFNSAKFFDMEYQTYGRVEAEPDEKQQQIFWQHPNKDRAITMAYNPKNAQFEGINTFGIRMRHGFFDTCLRKKKDVQYVLKHLRTANFDPEFYDRHQKEIFHSFKEQITP